jgi:hypothetical protein
MMKCFSVHPPLALALEIGETMIANPPSWDR